MKASKKEKELMLRSLALAGNAVRRYSHFDPNDELIKISDRIWKAHARLKK